MTLRASLCCILACAAAHASDPGSGASSADFGRTVQTPESLEFRCEQLLARQTALGKEMVNLARSIRSSPDGKPTSADERAALELASRQQEIVRQAEKVIQTIESVSQAVAFAEVFRMLRDDMRTVEKRLGSADVGPDTMELENDIVLTLEEMIQALKKARTLAELEVR
jgi:hypothetical protein